jgi:hypothetical protein
VSICVSKSFATNLKSAVLSAISTHLADLVTDTESDALAHKVLNTGAGVITKWVFITTSYCAQQVDPRTRSKEKMFACR